MAEPSYRDYPYPETTPGSSNNGKYWHQLSESNQEALNVVEQWVQSENVDLNQLGTSDLHHSLLLLRYLRANQFNTTKTIAHIQKNIEWRKTMNVSEVVLQNPEKILGCTLEELTAVFPHWHSGYDKTGRPVIYKQYGKFEAGLIKKLVGGKNFDNVVKYHLWEQEACGRLCLARSKQDKQIVETITGVVDIKDMGMSQITSDFLKLTKSIAEIDQHQYPETMGRVFIINAPSAFPLVWRMVKPWLDPATVAKIQVLGGPKEHIPVLIDFIGEENLPSNYGGSLPPLSPQVHPYAETMWSYPAPGVNVDVEARAAYERANDRNSLRLRPSSMRRKSFRQNSNEPAVEPSSLMYYPSLLWNGIQRNWFPTGGSPTDDNESEWDGSQHSDDSDELHFEDAFESQSDLETNSHSHLYSLRPNEGTSTEVKRKKKRRNVIKKFFLFKAIYRCYRAIMWDKTLRALSIQRLEMRFMISSAVHLFFTLFVAAVSSTALASISWTSSGTRLQLWSYTLVLLVSCFMIIFDVVGYFAIQAKNWPLLVMYLSGVTVGSLLFLSATIACFVYYSLPNTTGTSSLDSTLAENRSFMVIMALGTLFVFLCGISPIIYVRAVIIRLREVQGKILQTRQIQIVLKVAQSISIVNALAMLTYGGLGLEYLLSIHYAAAIFAVYGMEYGGVSVLITSTIGVWASNTVHRSVLRIYEYLVLPFIIALLLVVGVIAFSTLVDTDGEVHSAYPNLETSDTEEEVKSTVQSFLLVTGMLSVVLCVFQTISLVATSALRSTIDSNGQVKEKLAILQAIKEKELGIYSSGGIVDGDEVVNKDTYWSEFSVEHLGRLYMLYSRNQRDRFLIAWGIFMGLFNIFVNGSLAIFARHAAESELRDSWMFALLNFLGKADDRFIESDPFIRSSMTVLAAIVGPLMLFYAWTTFVYAPYRHVMGVLVTTSQMLIWLLYILMALYTDLVDFKGKEEPALLFFMIIFGFIFYVAIPASILYRELTTSINDTSTSDSHELLMEANNESKPFLDKFDFESLEGGTLYDSSSPNRLSNRRPPRNSDTSLEQMLAMGTRARKPATVTDLDDDESIASTRSFIRSLGGEDNNTEVELFRARAASAFCSSDSSTSTGPGTTRAPLYADKHNTPRKMSAAQMELNISEHRLLGEEKEEEKDDGIDSGIAGRPPRFASPIDIGRNALSPTRVRSMHEGLEQNLMTLAPVPDNSRVLTTYHPATAGSGPAPPLTRMYSGGNSTLSSFLRKRSVAPLKPRVAGERPHSLTGGMTQVAAATSAALDPNKVLPMLMKLGVSSVEAAGMMTYLMRMKELSEGKKKKNSLAMVV